MSLPFGFRYLRNMALYIFKSLKQSYIDDYGENLENKYDRADKTLYKQRVFCLDCPYHYLQYEKTDPKDRPIKILPKSKRCKGVRKWKHCPNKAMALKEMRR